jgi:hypothetical protein
VEREFLQCAADTIPLAVRIAAEFGQTGQAEETTPLLPSRDGTTLIGLRAASEWIGHLWSPSDGNTVPRWLSVYVDLPGESICRWISR